MKLLVIVTSFFFSVIAHAQVNIVTGVHNASLTKEGRRLYSIETLVCPQSFPFMTETLTQISENSFIVEILVFSAGCADKGEPARFWLDLDHSLKKMGVDPKGNYTFYFRLP